MTREKRRTSNLNQNAEVEVEVKLQQAKGPLKGTAVEGGDIMQAAGRSALASKIKHATFDALGIPAILVHSQYLSVLHALRVITQYGIHIPPNPCLHLHAQTAVADLQLTSGQNQNPSPIDFIASDKRARLNSIQAALLSDRDSNPFKPEV
ncbi:hypothetical protein BDN72DRAFT_884265 [Pluteus cervinus]|uniref:Uncharacterized protein n=1 Tax=Pluteus cervinus TaxID=181527 RepID=A0ACD2ZXX9_9AGAR|nr:hypothetical protein BDN72DRAFT_884265 [Pluteus cervinus]